MKSMYMITASAGVILATWLVFMMNSSENSPEIDPKMQNKQPQLWADNDSPIQYPFHVPPGENNTPLPLFNPSSLPSASSKANIPFKNPESAKIPHKPIKKNPPPPAPPSFRIVLDPKERTIFSSELNTPVAKIYKRMGDDFMPGDILMTLDKRIAEANYIKAKGKYNRALIEYGGKKQLYDQDLISFFEVKDAEAALAEAESDYITAEKFLSAATIKSAYRGKVVRLGIEEYELAQVGKDLIEVIRDDTLLGHFLAPASLLSCLKLGTELIVEVNNIKKKTAITRVSPVIDPTSATIKIETEIDNRDRTWTPGLVGKVSIICKPA
jgi:multidrug efflux pump subunit AcrA (membrane-fusion protein)